MPGEGALLKAGAIEPVYLSQDDAPPGGYSWGVPVRGGRGGSEETTLTSSVAEQFAPIWSGPLQKLFAFPALRFPCLAPTHRLCCTSYHSLTAQSYPPLSGVLCVPLLPRPLLPVHPAHCI